MINIQNIQTYGWGAAIRGMRNPLNSWAKSDSCWAQNKTDFPSSPNDYVYVLGPNDLDLACRLIKAGPEHRKFLRMIHIQMDITAPTFIWAELDTYKVSTVRDSCSKMHRIHVKSFGCDDFTHESIDKIPYAAEEFSSVLLTCERLRLDYNTTKDKKYWRALIELLPEGYNMLATWDGSLETILSICKQRKAHKLDEWEIFRQACFANIPYCAFYKK